MVYLFAWSPLLSVRTITIKGLPQGISEQAIIDRANISQGEKLARIEPRAVSTALEEIDWLHSVDIARHWWNGEVVISLQARTAIGIFNGRAIDASGSVFSYPGALSTSLPMVKASSTELALQGISLYGLLPSELKANLTSLTVWSETSMVTRHSFSPTRDVAIAWGGVKDGTLKVKVLQALLALPENATVKRIDLSAPHAPIVK